MEICRNNFVNLKKNEICLNLFVNTRDLLEILMVLMLFLSLEFLKNCGIYCEYVCEIKDFLIICSNLINLYMSFWDFLRVCGFMSYNTHSF